MSGIAINKAIVNEVLSHKNPNILGDCWSQAERLPVLAQNTHNSLETAASLLREALGQLGLSTLANRQQIVSNDARNIGSAADGSNAALSLMAGEYNAADTNTTAASDRLGAAGTKLEDLVLRVEAIMGELDDEVLPAMRQGIQSLGVAATSADRGDEHGLTHNQST